VLGLNLDALGGLPGPLFFNVSCPAKIGEYPLRSPVPVSSRGGVASGGIGFSIVMPERRNIYMYAADVSGPNSGWQQLGTWTVP
jgi:hypothetical protein